MLLYRYLNREYLCDVISFSLRDRAQVEQLLRYIIEEPPEDADSKRAFKYTFLTKNSLQTSWFSGSYFFIASV